MSRAVTMVGNFVEGALSFDAAITRSAIAMGLAADEADQLRNDIESLSASEEGSIFTQQQLAEAFRGVSDEGRGLEGTMSVLEAGMNLATATGDDLAQTTMNVEDILSAYNLRTEDAARVTDVLNSTMKETGASVGLVSGDLIQMGQVFTGLNMGIEESAALIGVLRDRGISNIQGLLTGFQQLAGGIGRGGELLTKFGVSATDATGKLKPMTTIFGELSAAGASAEDMFLAFGQRSATAMTAVINSLDEVRATSEANFAATGTAADDAAQFLDSDAAAAAEFEASIADLKDELAKGLLPAITEILEAMQPLLDVLTEYPEIILAVVAAFILYKIALIAYTIVQWAANIAALSFPVFLLIAGIAALIVILYLLVKHWDDVTAAILRLGEVILGGLLLLLDLAKAAIQEIIDVMLDLLDLGEKLRNMGNDIIDEYIEGMKDAFNDKKDEIGKVADDISKFFGGSLPEVGALVHIRTMGSDLMKEYVAGMQEADVSAQVGLVAQQLGAAPSTGEIGGTGGGGSGTVTNVTNNYLVDADDFIALISERQKDQIQTDRGTRGTLPA